MNKKAMMGDWIWWFFYIPMTAIIITLLVFMANSFITTKMETYNLEYYTISNKIVKSLSYVNPETQRLELGIIDLEKFEGNSINDITAYEGVGVKATLKGIENEIDKEIYSNKEFYEDYIFLSNTNQNIKKKIYVLVKDKDEIKKAVLEIDIIFSDKRKINDDE